MIGILFFCSALFGDEVDMGKVSETVGHMVARDIKSMGVDLDQQKLIKGLLDELNGKKAPLTNDECLIALKKVQKSSTDTQKATCFFIENSLKKDIVEVEKGKLQYRTLKKGSGEKMKEFYTPLVSINGEKMVINLSEYPFIKALSDMQEGEERIIYVHPSINDGVFITQKVELLKANFEQGDPLKQISTVR